jgi:hypothetical protein
LTGSDEVTSKGEVFCELPFPGFKAANSDCLITVFSSSTMP